MTLSSIRSLHPHSQPAPARAPIGSRPAPVAQEIADAARPPPDEKEPASAGLESLFALPRRLARRDTLCRTGDPFIALYLVRLGSLKSIALVDDGREQITGYAMTGDIVGLEGLGGALHACDVVAIEDSEVSALPIARLAEATRDPAMLLALFHGLANDLHRSQDLAVLLGSKRADERVATFLLDLAHRHWLRGYSARELTLRMTREEIASLLGLKLETVSRIFSRMQADGLVRVQGRAVTILDDAGLRGLAGARASPASL